jgi:hypothetical protein
MGLDPTVRFVSSQRRPPWNLGAEREQERCKLAAGQQVDPYYISWTL